MPALAHAGGAISVPRAGDCFATLATTCTPVSSYDFAFALDGCVRRTVWLCLAPRPPHSGQHPCPAGELGTPSRDTPPSRSSDPVGDGFPGPEK
jgi:hypothetical protein